MNWFMRCMGIVGKDLEEIERGMWEGWDISGMKKDKSIMKSWSIPCNKIMQILVSGLA